MAGRFSVDAIFRAVDRVSAPVARIQTRVRRFTRSMSRGLRSANRAVGRLVGSMGRGAAGVAKFGSAVLAVGSAAAVTALNRTADAADSLAKQSRRLDFPIEDLQEFKFVAEQSGVSTELLDSSLGAFSKRLGEAAGGTGPLVTGLKNLNPELLQQLKSADNVSDAFSIYIDAMRNSKSATEKAALANAAFSRAGLKLANISDNSAAAIKNLREEQRQNGNVTMEQAIAAEAYNDATNSLKKSLIGMIQQVLLPMLPAVTKTVKAFREFIIVNKDMIRTRITDFIENLKERIKALVLAVVEFNSKYDIAEMLGSGLDKLGKFAGFLERNGSMILKLIAGVVGLSVVLKTMTAVMAAVNLVMSLNPFGLVVLAIAALAAGVILLINYFGGFEKLGAAVMDAWASVAGFFTSLWDDVKDSFASAWAFIGKIVDKVKGAIDFVKNAPGKVREAASGAVDSATGAVKNAASGVAGFFGFGDDEATPQRAVAENPAVSAVRRTASNDPTFGDDEATPQQAGGGQSAAVVQSPQERVARSIEERRQTSSAEVTIRDESGRAEVTKGSMGAGVMLQRTGAL